MSDETFQRPGSMPAPGPVAPHDRATVWQPDAVAAAQSDPATSSATQSSASAPGPRRTLSHKAAIFGVAGLFIGLAAGATAGVTVLNEPPPGPIAITLDDFPREILGQRRDDLPLRGTWPEDIRERLDAEFRNQVTAYRFAHGGDGASLTYGNDAFSLTIVNAQLPNPPIAGGDPSTTIPTSISLESDQTACVSAEPPPEEPRPFELSDILDDESKDVFFWLDEGRVEARTECVLFDEDRSLSLRLDGSGSVENNRHTAGWLRDELVEIHADLTG